jgi:hypothetical protein
VPSTLMINDKTGLLLPLRFSCLPQFVAWRPGSCTGAGVLLEFGGAVEWF